MKIEKIKKFFETKTARSLVILSAVLLIGLAVYLNYQWFYDPVGSIGYGDNNMENNVDGGASGGGEATGEENYFTSTALNRQEARDEAVDVLKLITENEEASEAARADAAERISQIAVDIQNEANIETLVKAKGFEECVAVISEGAVSVIVSAESLSASDTAKILSIVYETTGVSPSKVSIINK